MDILNALKQLRDDLKTWATNNFNALNTKIDEKTIPIDNKLDLTSTNPVQNNVITNAINNIPKFSGDYNDLTNAPNITEDDNGNMVIADESGNIIFKADADGMHTTALTLNGENAATEKYVDNAKKDLGENLESENGELSIVDGNGNVIFKIDADGAHTTNITVDGESIKNIVGGGSASAIPDDEMLEFLMDMDVIQPISNTNNVVYTDTNNKIYVL